MGPAGLWKGWAPFSVACSEKEGAFLQFELGPLAVCGKQALVAGGPRPRIVVKSATSEKFVLFGMLLWLSGFMVSRVMLEPLDSTLLPASKCFSVPI